MKFLWCVLLLVSCAHKITQDGGQEKFSHEAFEALTPETFSTYAQSIVLREQRDPDGVTLAAMAKSPDGAIRKVGIVIFESELQASRSGLATDRNVYLSPRGKQLLTEDLYQHLKAELERLGGAEWVGIKALKKSKNYQTAGSPINDYILSKNYQLTDEDAFWKKPGERIPEASLLSPRGFQDVSLLLVPATDIMGGAKPNQHQHHWVNDLCGELGLDAVLLVYVDSEWRRGGVDKRTKAIIPEEMKLKVTGSLVYPWGTHHKIAQSLRKSVNSKLNVPLAAYSVSHVQPVLITLPEAEETFENAKTNVIELNQKTLKRLLQLFASRVQQDILGTQLTASDK